MQIKKKKDLLTVYDTSLQRSKAFHQIFSAPLEAGLAVPNRGLNQWLPNLFSF